MVEQRRSIYTGSQASETPIELLAFTFGVEGSDQKPGGLFGSATKKYREPEEWYDDSRIGHHFEWEATVRTMAGGDDSRVSRAREDKVGLNIERCMICKVYSSRSGSASINA